MKNQIPKLFLVGLLLTITVLLSWAMYLTLERVELKQEAVPSNWKTYNHPSFDFMIRYPTTWTLGSDLANPFDPGQTIYFLAPDSEQDFFTEPAMTIGYDIRSNTFFKTFKDIENFYQRESYPPEYTFSVENAILGGEKALVVHRSDLTNYEDIYVYHSFPNGVYPLLFHFGVDYKWPEVVQMLSTFHFIKK